MSRISSVIYESKAETEKRLRIERLYGDGCAIPKKPCKPEIVNEFREVMTRFIKSYENGTNIDVRKALGH